MPPFTFESPPVPSSYCSLLLVFLLLAGLSFSFMFSCLLRGRAQISAAEDSYPTKLEGLGKQHNVEQSGVWEPNMTVGKNELHTCIVMVQECMARRSSCARAMWIHRLCFRSLVLKPLVWGTQFCWVHWPPVVFGVAEIPMGCLSCPWLNWLHCLLLCASEQMLASSDLLYVLLWCVCSRLCPL